MSFLDLAQALASGIVTASQPFTSWLNDTRAPDLSRLRTDSSNPTSTIDQVDSTSILNFPHDRPKYYITFGFQDYSRPSQFEGLQASSVSDYICLPIPNNLRDNNTLTWTEDRSNIIVESAAAAVNEHGLNKTGGVNSTDVANALRGAGAAGTGAAVKVGIDALQKVSNLAPNAVGQNLVQGGLQILGLADNPFMTVAFKGPEFKTHNFFWRLAPKTKNESDTVKNIIATFKKCSYPELLSAETGGFFKYPKIVRPRFMPSDAESYLYSFKPCVITNLNINNSPNDRPGFFPTSAPVEVVLEIQLTEIELWRNGGGINPDQNNGDFNNVQTPPGVTFRDIGQI